MKISGYDLCWIFFWIGFFTSLSFKYYFKYKTDIFKIETDAKISKLRNDSNRALNNTLKEMTQMTQN